MISLPILHFNDVYRVRPFKLVPTSPDTIDVSQWAAMVNDVRDKWQQRPDGKREGLLLFSGDVFAPSTESSVTRGSHMVWCSLQCLPLESIRSPLRVPGARHERDRSGRLPHRYLYNPNAHEHLSLTRLQATMILISVSSGGRVLSGQLLILSRSAGYPHLTSLLLDSTYVSLGSMPPRL